MYGIAVFKVNRLIIIITTNTTDHIPEKAGTVFFVKRQHYRTLLIIYDTVRPLATGKTRL